MGLKYSNKCRYASGRISDGYMIGVRYIHAWIRIWYISEISGNRTATLESNKLTPSEKAVSNRIGMGINRIAQVIGRRMINMIASNGTSERIRFTIPVPMDE